MSTMTIIYLYMNLTEPIRRFSVMGTWEICNCQNYIKFYIIEHDPIRSCPTKWYALLFAYTFFYKKPVYKKLVPMTQKTVEKQKKRNCGTIPKDELIAIVYITADSIRLPSDCSSECDWLLTSDWLLGFVKLVSAKITSIPPFYQNKISTEWVLMRPLR